MAGNHPIQPGKDIPIERRMIEAEIRLAQLWDEVWWHHLPFWKRWYYWLRGFRCPIEKFYED